ncbi:T9SS type A sorting domain-containing protein [Gillisia sp. Hel_I_29]|uniref:T9SS type A sorting domain-containing protein n=1 Tax=Gillisia sp. Hel_I_29 TaxID=1249975 RepID=UPI000556236C|nr:T9SS type A sorting domain-containing protein [Gillisia sp. Hel_I_29]
MKDNFNHSLPTGNAQNARFVNRVVVFFVFFFSMLFFSEGVVGQNGLTITSTESPGPTSENPIPITIEFDDAVDFLSPIDFSIINGQDLQNLLRTDVNFEYKDEIDFDPFLINITTSELITAFLFDSIDELFKTKLGASVISIDFNSKNELFYLTLNNGIYKLGDPKPVITKDKFDSPLDFVINRTNGNFYVADNGKKQVLIFDSNYQELDPIGNGTNGESDFPRGATGIALDAAGNIYVADNFNGQNDSGKDAIKIYQPNGKLIRKTSFYNSEEIIEPFRIAVDKNNNIYLSDSGGTNGRILIFDNNFNPITIIEGVEQGTPGSLIVDDYGYLYAIDYKSDFNLTNLFNDPLEVLNNYETIRDTKYTVNVFNTNKNYTFVKKFDNAELNLPIDIALNSCGLIHINNLKLSGIGPMGEIALGDEVYPTSVNATFDFSIRKFKRQDTFTAEVVPDAPGEVSVSLKDIDFFKCDPQPRTTFSIEYKPEDNTTLIANCKAITLSLDAVGNATLTASQVYDGDAAADNVTLSLSKYNFNCADIGKIEVVLTVTDKDEPSLSDTCSAEITIIDDINPDVKCIAPGKEFFLVDGSVTIAASDIDNGSTDNCAIVNREVTPKIFTTSGIKSVTLIVTDAYGKISQCNTTINVLDNTPPEAKCKPVNLFLDSNGKATLTAAQVYDGNAAADNVTLSLSKYNYNCADIGKVDVVLTVTNKDEPSLSDTCSAEITIIDDIIPDVKCIAPGKEFFLVDGSVTIAASDIDNGSTDNCAIVNREVTPKIFTTSGIKSVTLKVTDASGKISQCTTTINVLDNTPPEAKCKPVNLFLDSNGTATLTAAQVYDGNAAADNVILSLSKYNYNCADIGKVDVVLTVTNKDEPSLSDTCSAEITIIDDIIPDVKCLEDKLIAYTDSKSFRLEDYREQLTISDNCSSNFEIVQTPASGTIITENTTVNFSVTDENNNQSGCSFNIKFFKESELQILNCPGDQFFQVDENCSYAIPELASTISTNIEGATVTQNITAGFSVNNDLTLVITAKFEDQMDTCEVKLITTDAIFPTIECPTDQTEMVQQGEGFQLPNYILNAVYDDNCFIQELKQQPDVGTVIYDTTEIILTVVDSYGNSTECTFNVNIITENPDLQITCLEDQTGNLDANCQFQLPDYTQQAQANFDAVITQSPLPGSLISSDTKITLTATGDTGQTSCSFNINVVDATPPVVKCVGIINLRLDAGGTASLSPQDLDDTSFDACDSISRTLSKSDFSVADLGTNILRLTVTDASGNSGFCDTTVNVLPYEENAIDFTCKESFILQLDNNGEAQLSSEDLYTGTAGNYQFSVDKTSFTCADKGSNTVTLYYSDGNTGGNCRVEVVVEDLLPPVVRTKDISITLDANGTASITTEMLNDGSIDNCGDIRLFLDKTDFTCNNLGENRVILRAQDGSSNPASATATVTVLGNCQEPPVTPTGPGYIFIYPNPTDGPFSYYLPAGIALEKVEVYDMQGKYITTTLFEEGTVQYKMNLSYLQSAVYVLKLYTNKEELILRVIVR